MSDQQTAPQLAKGLLFAAITLLIWSSFHLVSRIGGNSELTVFDIEALRVGTAAVLLSPWWLPRLINQSKRKLSFRQLIILAMLIGIGYPLVTYTGYEFSQASHGAVIIVGLLPPFTALFAYRLLGETPNRLRIVAIVCVVFGVALMLGSVIRNTGFNADLAIGDAIFALSSLLWALFTVLLHRWKLKAFDVTLGISAMSAILYLPVYFLALPSALHLTSWEQIALQTIFQGVFVPVVATFTYAMAIQHLGATRSVMVLSATPAMGALLGVLFLDEPMFLWAAVGIVVVSIGSLVGGLSQTKTVAKVPVTH